MQLNLVLEFWIFWNVCFRQWQHYQPLPASTYRILKVGRAPRLCQPSRIFFSTDHVIQVERRPIICIERSFASSQYVEFLLCEFIPCFVRVSSHARLTKNTKGKAIARPIKEHTDKHFANQRRLRIKNIERQDFGCWNIRHSFGYLMLLLNNGWHGEQTSWYSVLIVHNNLWCMTTNKLD